MDAIAVELQARLPVTGRLFAAALAVAARAGGRAATVFDRLALRATDEAAIARERATATAQVRLSAWIVGGLPLVAIAFAAASGRLEALVASGPFGVVALVVGLTLVGSGLAVVVLVVRRRS
jgi:tight adherence protein B